ncbi:GGDEF domain-containing protein [Kibdelosporangium persicum]|uniref:Diguanylate cyclase/phosphodiesterase (GGDEF & EAL domains) with PAS/PAC sensor(S) n=1 Tax=Kibdelosporangium persicum TaxID=2698649 RepID=A0ABX2F1K2_9PSEU|nr:GGDEF domain-containing protein [Kibdelosporangium persicum]NRN65009.1 Diguanylate cyclase/phosphodiesterase (GGDEF & EAL domains) with PAS/PAC sensor(S) [Kibdelosporangium persicum]
MSNSSSCGSCGHPHGPWATDRLTMLLDRWGWDAEAPRLLASCSTTALVVIDLDNFKHVNDKHGHVAGDAVLRAVADALRQNTRKGDLLGRYGGHGGDEFLILLPETVLDEALAVTERVRQAIRALVVPAPVQGGTVTIDSITASFGVAIGGPDSSLEALIVEADTALRTAKKSRRGRVRTPARRSCRVPLAIVGAACAAGIAVLSVVSDAPSAEPGHAAPPPPPLPTVTLPAVTVPTTVTMTATVQPSRPAAPPVPKPKRPSSSSAPAAAASSQDPSARRAEKPPAGSQRPCVLCDMVDDAVQDFRSLMPR